MHRPRSGAAALPSTLLSLLLLLPGSSLGASPAIADRAACIRKGALGISTAAACGDRGSLANCFRHVGEYVLGEDLERCFRNAGCTYAESTIEAAFVLHNCDNGKSVADLRRRGPEPIPAPTPAPEPVPAPQNTNSGSSSPASPSTAAGSPTQTLQCSTSTNIKTSTCPVQSTGSDSGKTLPCYETEVPTQVCAAENYCMTDRNGADVCMRRKNDLDTGEIVVTVFLASCFGIGFVTLIFFCCRDKREQRRRRARAEAAKIAKTAAANPNPSPSPSPNPDFDLAAKRDGPLPAANPSETTIAVADDYAHAKRDTSPAPLGQNPFTDNPGY